MVMAAALRNVHPPVYRKEPLKVPMESLIEP